MWIGLATRGAFSMLEGLMELLFRFLGSRVSTGFRSVFKRFFNLGLE